METKLAKWGNSVGLRLPKELLAQTGLQTGDALSVTVEKGGSIVLRAKTGKVSLADLLGGITPDNLHSETDWGEATGGEGW